MRLPCSVNPTTRPALSLLEVLVALTIFLLSLVALSHLINLGGNLANQAQQRSEAASLCQTKLAEVVAGAVPLQSSGSTPFDEAPDYQWSVQSESGTSPGLNNVTVTVSRQAANGQRLEVSLSQMVLDPAILGSTQDTPPSNNASTTTSSSGSSSSADSSSPTSAPASPSKGMGGPGKGSPGMSNPGSGKASPAPVTPTPRSPASSSPAPSAPSMGNSSSGKKGG
jgi:general secretion pathway protein I